MSKSFEERMKELEEGYNDMPDTVSADQIIQNVESTKKKSSWRKIYTTGGGILAAGIAALLIMSQPGLSPGNGDSPPSASDNQEESQEMTSQQDEDTPALTRESAVELMNSYKESFVSLINETDNQKIESYQTTDEVKQHFANTMSDELATWMTDSYFTEEDDGVYVIAKDGPTWFQEDQSFELEEVSEGHVKIVQERENELLGHVNMVYHASFQENQWVVDDIETNELGGSEGEETSTDSEDSIKDTAQTVLDLINSQDMGTLSTHVHPDKGVLFSPYVNIQEDARVFQQEEVANFFDDDQEYEWGVYDGRGDTIELTPAEYYEEFIYEADLQNPDEVLVDERKQRGNMRNNIKDVFPDATVVEFHKEASENGGMDWVSLNLVFEDGPNGNWKLIAIVHDEWTI
ncbi:hypothetical protein D7Z54_08130 [Salibacterium salarium]|uniref:Uncharacterized protein n=1 Tax=Salibacterium salarium TaxID=284579 RepID=A0A3R9P923_9BACI|nr:hypothetical protein [Salibacterium salarium]RSL34065.1 hypothetical protein D7Z54_08130 [Salibacterium salarium]